MALMLCLNSLLVISCKMSLISFGVISQVGEALTHPPFIGLLPPNVPANEGDGIDDEYKWRNQSPIHNVPPPHASPAHTPPSTHPFTGTSTGHYITEEILREKRAREKECDGLSYAMYEHQQDTMDFMRESQRHTE